MTSLEQYALPGLTGSFNPDSAEDINRRQQATRDAQVVREILDGCREERRRQARHLRHNRSSLYSWLLVGLQTAGKLFVPR